ncbi:hypothetical protein ACIGHB_29870 [Streptomyces sp. NPDC085460]|uniref:hypothetical protein n=1 Tax=Streptomyces sp. NPDC085460 TaxID=3365723 RepID=UPI0037CED77A
MRLGTDGGHGLVVGAGQAQILANVHRAAVRGDGGSELGDGAEFLGAAGIGAHGVTAGAGGALLDGPGDDGARGGCRGRR